MKKIVAMLLSAALAAGMLAGCSSPAASSSASAAPDASAPASDASTAAPAAGTPNVDAIKAKGKIVMATNAAFPPFEYLENNVISGVDADIAAEIAKDLGVELEITDLDFNAIIPAIKNGQADFGAAGMTINDERKTQVDFSIEYVKSSQYVVIVKGSGTTVESLKEAGVKIGVQEGTTGQFYSADEIKGDEASPDVLAYKNALVAAQDLMNGKCTAVIIDELPAKSIVAANPDKLELIPDKLTEESYAIAIKKGNTDLVAAIDATLTRLMAEGKVDEFVIKHAGA